MNKKLLLVALVAVSVVLTGCGKKSVGSLLGQGTGTGTGSSLKGTLSGLLPGILNANGGKLSKAVTGAMEQFAWKKESLPNFDRVSGDVYRGGQPRPSDGWQQLRDKGIRTVINLRFEAPDADAGAKALGMNCIYIPIPDTNVPTRAQVQQFRKAIAEAGPCFLHCSAGKFRTSTMAAIVKIDQGATGEQALADAYAHGFQNDWMDSPKEEAFIRAYAANPDAWR